MYARFAPSTYYPDPIPKEEAPVEILEAPIAPSGAENIQQQPNTPKGYQQNAMMQQHQSPRHQQVAPSPAVRTPVDIEPVISSYACGAELPTYYCLYGAQKRPIVQPTEEIAPVEQEPEPYSPYQAASPAVQSHNGYVHHQSQHPPQSPHHYSRPTYAAPQGYRPAQPAYQQQPQQHSYAPSPKPQQQVRFTEPAPAPSASAAPSAAPLHSMEPSSYAFGGMNDGYAYATYGNNLQGKSSSYAPVRPEEPEIVHESETGEPDQTYESYGVAPSPFMDSTQQLTMSKTGGHHHQQASSVRTPLHQEQHVQPTVQRTESSPQKMHYPLKMLQSAYMGGVPNDLIAAYEPKPEVNYAKSTVINNIGESKYHFQPESADHGDISALSAITCDVNDPLPTPSPFVAPLPGMAKPHTPEPINMHKMTEAIWELQNQLPGTAFAPLTVAPCSEYQFDQLQDLRSCIGN